LSAPALGPILGREQGRELPAPPGVEAKNINDAMDRSDRGAGGLTIGQADRKHVITETPRLSALL
jgi:hypothetical protein